MITHGKINGRASVNLKISILDSRTNHSSRLNKAKWQKEKKTKENKTYLTKLLTREQFGRFRVNTWGLTA